MTTQSNAELDCTDLTHEQIERILHWHISAQQQLLQGLMEEMPDDTIVATKYGYHSREKKYGFRMGIHEAQSVIQNKLEGLQ